MNTQISPGYTISPISPQWLKIERNTLERKNNKSSQDYFAMMNNYTIVFSHPKSLDILNSRLTVDIQIFNRFLILQYITMYFSSCFLFLFFQIKIVSLYIIL